MRQKVRDEEHGIVLILTDIEDHCLPALFDNNAVNSQRERHILILLDSPVIMRIEVAETTFLIDGILLDIQPGGVNVGAQDIDALLKGLFSDAEKHHGFIHPDTVDTVSGYEPPFLGDCPAQFDISVLFGFIYEKVDALPLCLSHVQKVDVILREIHAVVLHNQIVSVPRIQSFHFLSLLPNQFVTKDRRVDKCPAPPVCQLSGFALCCPFRAIRDSLSSLAR